MKKCKSICENVGCDPNWVDEEEVRFHIEKLAFKRIQNWDANHRCNRHLLRQATTGERLSYTFMPSAIGTYIHVKCHSCGQVFDATDTSTW